VSFSRQHITAVIIVAVIVIADLATKAWALRALADGRQLEWFGGLVPLTLAFNTGAAFGLSIGDDPRWIFVPITLAAVLFLTILIVQAGPGDRLRTVSASLVLGGALGNLYDRVRWDRGVVDFIGPIDLGFMHWPIFNVADMAITVGAILLAIAFWGEERRARAAMDDAGRHGQEPSTEDSRPDPTRG
jgi:signal peptidase II